MHDPLADHLLTLLTPENAALLLIDYQPPQLAGARSMDRMLPVKNAVSTVKTIKTFEPQPRATGVAAGGHLAHDRQAVGIGVQRLADEPVHRARAVVLRGIDVVHSGRDSGAQDPQRLVAIARRPEDPVAGEPHSAVPGPAHVLRAEREGPAEFPSVPGHAASCRTGRHGWTCEPKPRSRRIDSSMWNAVLGV